MSVATKEELVITEEGKCAVCGGKNVQYGDSEVAEQSVYYEIDCDDCGACGREWYNLEYQDTRMVPGEKPAGARSIEGDRE